MPSSHPVLSFSLFTFHPKCVSQGQLLPVQYELSKSNRDRDQLIQQVKELQEAQVCYALSCCQRSYLISSTIHLLPSTIYHRTYIIYILSAPCFFNFFDFYSAALLRDSHCTVLFCTALSLKVISSVLSSSPHQNLK
jgi:hypothetical protein